MEIGGFFLLVIVLVVLAIVGGGVYAIAARLRQKQLDPHGDRLVEGEEREARPEHLEVENERGKRFVGTR